MQLGFGKPTAEEEALQEPDIQPSDAWNIPKGLAALGAAMPAAIIKLFHGTSKPAARAIQQHGFDPARVGSAGDAGTPTQGWYGRGMYFTEDPKAAREYAGNAQMNMEFQHPQIRPVGGVGGSLSSEKLPIPHGTGFRNARILQTQVHDTDLLDATQKQYMDKLNDYMTGTPQDGRDFILRRQQWAQSILDDAIQSGKLGARFGPHEYVIPDPKGLGFGERKVR